MATCANLACALRWRRIVTALGQSIGVSAAIRLYFQGVTANTVLPGGIIGGDIWRITGLVRQGMSKLQAAQTVLLDRVSGFWALAVWATVALLLTWSASPFEAPAPLKALYLLAMASIAIGPLVLLPIRAAQSRLVLRTAWISLASQLLTISAFLACMLALGLRVDVLAIAALCAGIFLGAVVPASIGGFGSREVASLFFLSTLGVEVESAFLISVLFGLLATAQGLLFLLTLMNQGGLKTKGR